MKNLFYRIVEFILKIIRWDIQFYCVGKNKKEKAEQWLEKHLLKMSKQQGLNIKVVNNIYSDDKNCIILGQYYHDDKIVLSKKSFYFFNKYITWMHELAHHFALKIGIIGHDEKKIDDMILPIIKTFPAWVINTLRIQICADFNIKEDNFMKEMGLTYYNILKSERIYRV